MMRYTNVVSYKVKRTGTVLAGRLRLSEAEAEAEFVATVPWVS